MSTEQNDNGPLVVEKLYPFPLNKVWQALTDKEKLRQWLFDVDDFEPEVGFEFHFYGQNEGREFYHICVVTEVIVNQKLTYSWRYQNHPGSSYVTYELFEEGDDTRVSLTHTGIETFPEDNPDFARKNFSYGWNYLIGVSLPEYLEKS